MNLNWKVTTFSVAFFATFTWLGFWQLDRAAEKVALLAQESKKLNRVPISLMQLQREPGASNGTRVELVGGYLAGPVILLDNRILEGQVGFEVLAPFEDTATERVVLLNRGFVPMGRTRSDMPQIPEIVPGSSRATGTVYHPDDARKATPEMVSSGGDALIILQVPSPALVADQFARPVYEQVIRLDEQDPNALPRYWPATVMPPQKHRGYAVQWFLMALAIAIAWAVFTFREKLNDQEAQDD